MFEAVVLGTDINTYYMCRNFHEEYGIKPHVIGKQAMSFTGLSSILTLELDDDLWNTEVFKKRLKDYAKKSGNKEIILVATNDTYVRLIVENADFLRQWYLFSYVDKEMLDTLLLKEKFYQTYNNCGIDIPQTYFYNCSTKNYDFKEIEKLGFPLILKASNNIMWHDCEYPGQAKVYKIFSEEELQKTIKDIEASSYTDTLILQEFINGDDSCLFDSIFFCDSEGVPRLQSFAQVGLQEHTPSGIGNCTVLINGFNEYENTAIIKDRLKDMLATMKYRGFAEFDLKYDPIKEKFFMLEINPRQARSSYYLTACGYNLAKYLVDDLLYHKKPDFHFIDDEMLLSFVPPAIIKKHINNEKFKNQALKLIKEKKMVRVLDYHKDKSLKRKFWLLIRDMNYSKKYKVNKW